MPFECDADTLRQLTYRVGNKQLLFDDATEKFTNSEEANAVASGTYHKGYAVAEEM